MNINVERFNRALALSTESQNIVVDEYKKCLALIEKKDTELSSVKKEIEDLKAKISELEKPCTKNKTPKSPE